MKLERCATIEEIKEKSKLELLVIPKSAFQKCIITDAGYFDGTRWLLINKFIVFEKIINNGYFLITPRMFKKCSFHIRSIFFITNIYFEGHLSKKKKLKQNKIE